MVNFLNRKIFLLLPVLTGTVTYLLIFGKARLNPTNITWLTHTNWQDSWGAYLGWETYRQSPWKIPIGLNYNYGTGIGNSVVYTDSIPLVSIPLKLLNNFLPETFQFFGVWILVCLVMQGVVAWKIISKFTNSYFIILICSIFFIFSPIMLNRANTHMSQMAHFIILIGLYLSINKTRNQFKIKWPTLIIISALIHPYFFVMNFMLFVANVFDNTRTKVLTIFYSTKYLILVTIVTIFFLWQVGYFVSIDGAKNPFPNTLFKMDLAQPLNLSGWSHLFSSYYPVTLGNIEGFNYFGLGIWILIVYIALMFKFFKLSNFRSYLGGKVFFLGTLIVMLFYSVSYKVTFLRKTIIEIELNQFFIDAFSSFRASGRFFMPVYYSIIILIFYYVIKNLSFSMTVIPICFALVIQIFDSSYFWGGLSEITKKNSLAISNKYSDEIWFRLAQTHNKFLIIPPNITTNYWCDWQSLGFLVVKYHLQTNCFYFARVSEKKTQLNRAMIFSLLSTGKIPEDTIVIIPEGSVDKPPVNLSLISIIHDGDKIYLTRKSENSDMLYSKLIGD